MNYTDILKKHFENDPNVTVRELPDSFKVPGWEKAQLREQISIMRDEIESKRNKGIALVKNLGTSYGKRKF